MTNTVPATFQEAIKARFLQGFSEWNKGYDAWLDWCDELYEPDAHYNVYDNRLTLQQYKDMMKELFASFDIELGEFHNIIIDGDWGAIRYTVYITNKGTGERIEQKTMEFVNFKDNPAPVGARVIEGWALSDKPLA
jgi:SnoaL-like domain